MASDQESTSITTLTLSVDYVSADQEYGRLIKFIQNLPQPTKSHITGFLYPFYVYVYVYLLSEDKVSDAQKFLSVYAEPFLKADGYRSAIKSLFEFKTLQDVRNHSYFKRFCESKFVVKVSEDSLKCFISFLQEAQSTILLSILFSHFHVEDSKNCVAERTVPNKVGTDKENEISKQSTLETSIETRKTTALKKLSSYFYTITDGLESLCVADINSKYSLLACGFDNSSVHLWTLIPDSMTPKENIEESPSLKHISDDSKESQASVFENKMIFCPNPDKILRGHDGSVYGLAFTPKNELLLTCSEDCTARAWNLENYETVAIYSDHNFAVWDIAVSDDSAYFATASKDSTARLWCFERDIPIRIFVGHSADVDSVKFHSNGQYVASASSDKTIRLWTVIDAHSVRHFTGHNTCISCIAFSPNGRHLASADDCGCIKIWDLGSGQQINEIQAHRNRILSIAYNRNGSLLASGGFDNYLKVWDVQCCTDMKKSLTENPSGIQNFPSIGLVDSTSTDSILHFVNFRKRDLLLSVATNCNRSC